MMINQKMLMKVSWMHLFVLSFAVNFGLLLKVSHETDRFECMVIEKRNDLIKFAVEAIKAWQKKETSNSMVSGSSSEVNINGKDDGKTINLDHGDPTIYENYWKNTGDKTSIVIPGWQGISYFSDGSQICWFLEPEFRKSVTRLHKFVGNAVSENRHMVVGTGSSQLISAVLYALSPPDTSEPIDVVSAAPFYSVYTAMTDFLKSGLHRWAGDANKYDKDRPYIELVTSPNNPDGSIRRAVVNGTKGILIHDLAYYWPQYTPITFAADYDIMLFTVSKSSGHAGSRIGWALVKDAEIAKRMTKYIEISTIGVSKDSQLRAAKILDAISLSYDKKSNIETSTPFFEYVYDHLSIRWKKLREAVGKGDLFSLPDSESGECKFTGRVTETLSAFAWLKCEGEIEDCEKFLKGHNIIARSGLHFGSSAKYVRISMLDREEKFLQLTKRLARISSNSVA